RLLTLTGTGGCGKTRLALQVAAEMLESYADGVWFVDLAPLSDGTLLPQTILVALGVRETPGMPSFAVLVDHLRTRHTLLVVDNSGSGVAAWGGPLGALLRACPRLYVLATSREAVGVGGEVVWRVPSLSLLDPDADVTVAGVSRCAAVRLF